jgi:uncharacterized protein YqgV (UPF0045/DUF77 family)
MITGQVSLYTLRQQSLSPSIKAALRIFEKHGLDVKPGTMSTLISGSDSVIFSALREAFGYLAERGQIVLVVTLSNACADLEGDNKE